MGGVGKTTLAHLVYKEKRVEEHFDLKVWVTVKEEFDVLRITREIVKKINGENSDDMNLHQLQEELEMALNGKKVLIVLDDVWNEDYISLDSLMSPFKSGSYGSKIIVTTRSKNVASKMHTDKCFDLFVMKDDDCWELFKEHASMDANNREKLEEIGKEIVKKCKGLPLAVKSIAGVLLSSSDIRYWRSIRDSDIWELQFQEDQKNKIPPALWLSYCSLPDQIKRCFVYCSIFPKDYKFDQGDREKLVLLWMAEGLLQPQGDKSVEDVGNECLNDLISRSFFQYNHFGAIVLVMHDLIHDLPIRMSGEFCILSSNCNIYNDLRRKTIHISCSRQFKYKTKLMDVGEGKYLRTLLTLPLSRYYPNLIDEVMDLDVLSQRFGGYLRALSLSEHLIMKIPDSIKNLKYLRYLDLSNSKIEEVPISVCTLYNLQTLLLANCSKLKCLPNNMYMLINLHHLDIRNTPIQEMPSCFGELKNLQKLSDFVVSENEGSRIEVLGGLQLFGDLCISRLEKVDDAKNASKANLKKKVNLKILHLRWEDGEANDSVKEYEVLKAFQPRIDLAELYIERFRGTKFPDWLAHQSFQGMVEIQVDSCINCYSLPPFGQLPSLKRLTIQGMDGLVSIGEEFCGINNAKPFPSLEHLWINSMNSWEKWSFTEREQGVSIFPCLKSLWFRGCGKLKVGFDVENHFPHLESVSISNCKSMVSVFTKSQYPLLQRIYLNNSESLESFSEMGWPVSLKLLKIWECERLIANRMNWNLQKICSLQSITLTCVEEKCSMFPEKWLLPSNLNNLKLVEFKNMKGLNGKSLECLTSLRRLEIIRCYELKCLPKEGLPTSLTELVIYNCSSEIAKRCKRKTGKDWPKIQHIININLPDMKDDVFYVVSPPL